MATTRRRAKQAAIDADAELTQQSTQEQGQDALAEPKTHVPWYLWERPDSDFELHPDDDGDVPAPLFMKAGVAIIITWLCWAVFIGQPPWPPITYDC